MRYPPTTAPNTIRIPMIEYTDSSCCAQLPLPTRPERGPETNRPTTCICAALGGIGASLLLRRPIRRRWRGDVPALGFGVRTCPDPRSKPYTCCHPNRRQPDGARQPPGFLRRGVSSGQSLSRQFSGPLHPELCSALRRALG